MTPGSWTLCCLFQSIVKICFHERRLQYMEKEQIDSWQNTRPGERILDIDVPLSYGLIDVNIDRERLNGAEFVWDPTKESGVYIRVNCISTEFTAKKHGGEKGVPFRLQIDTYTHGENESKLVHCGSCQIKVFKPKGADRKHKTDREKMEKRTEAEKEKYQPSYECTVLTEVSLEQVTHVATSTVKSPNNAFASLTQSFSDLHAGSPAQNSKTFPGDGDDSSSCNGGTGSTKKLKSTSSTDDLNTTSSFKGKPLTCDASACEVTAWLQANRFNSYKEIFQNFSGGDILRLTRDDLIQICGLADGIRLNNALQAKAIRPRLIIYVCQESDSVYHALYLEHLTSQELLEKLAQLYNVNADQIGELYCQGPSGIYVLLNDEVLQNMSEQSRFCVEAMKSDSSDQYKVLLKSIS
ncbi:transcription factor CP2-like [Saccostrea cucullata]|uniref:transcription factor CP2-like n=1 Tax=Saccostrea cuccullata TaxID=36930 RepID=UPI002ED5AD42